MVSEENWRKIRHLKEVLSAAFVTTTRLEEEHLTPGSLRHFY